MMDDPPALARQAVPQASPKAIPAAGALVFPAASFADVAPVSAYDMILRVPGFSLERGQSVRGLAGSGGNVLIDGRPPVTKSDAIDEILKRIPAATVDRIELLRGGGADLAAEGRSVVANVVLKRTSGFRGAVMLGNFFGYDGGAYPGLRLEGRWRWADGRSAELSQIYGAGLSYEYGDGARVRYGRDGAPALASDVEADGVGAKIWTFGGFETPIVGGRLRLNGALMFTPGEVEIYDRFRGSDGLEYEKDDLRRRQVEAGARFNRGFSGGIDLEAALLQQWGRNTTRVAFSGPGVARDFDLRRDTRESVARALVRRTATKALTLELGGEFALNDLDSRTDLVVNGAPRPVPAANVHVQERRGELRAGASWRMDPSLTLDAGLRYEVSRITSAGDVALGKSLAYAKPRLALTWTPARGWQVRARAEREVGQLKFDDFVASPQVASTGNVLSGNPDLAPEQAWVGEVAVERRVLDKGAAVVTFRRAELRNVIDRIPILSDRGVALADAPGNLAGGRKTELALSLTTPIDLRGLRRAQIRGEAVWRWSDVLDPLTGRRRDISGLHPVDWEVHFTQELPQAKARWGLDVTGGSRERYFRLSEVETRKLTPSVTLFTEWRPRAQTIVSVEAQGLTSHHVQRIREVYVGPRSQARRDYVDVRRLRWGGAVYVRVRRVFGRGGS